MFCWEPERCYRNIHWPSKETYHFFRATLIKSHAIKINNIWTQISLNTMNIWKTQDFLLSKRRKMQLNHERSFFENHRNCSASELWASSTEAAYSGHSNAIHSISMAGYVNAVPAFVCFELPAREASSFCDIWNLTILRFIAFISSLIEVNIFVFYMCLLRMTLPNLCPNMIHVDALDFSEWHSEEVISFFWRSVYFV